MDRDDDRHSTISEKEKEQRWDSIHSRTGTRNDIRSQYDGWLEQDSKIATVVKGCKTPILDLGCGVGIDTLHLIEEGHQVVACDFSNVALEKVKQNIPEAVTRQFNIAEGIPFTDEQFELIIGNKSIHYFSEQQTRELIDEIYRNLKANGYFAFVVNSTKDDGFGAGQGTLLEKDFYEVRGTTKRFFSEESLKEFFDSEHWEFIAMNEVEIQDERLKTVTLQVDGKESPNKKISWNCMVKKK